ncbi:MAG: hypothetical protein U0704_07715 [Candidatus Eisenbacteria bacterium]
MTTNSKLAMGCSALALLLAASVAAADPMDLLRRPARTPRPPRVQTPGFHASGTYSGSVGGQLIIDGVSYPLRTNTKPYLIGYGPVEVNEVPIGSRVFATIVNGDQGNVIWGLIVRPPDDPRTAGADMHAFVRVHDPNAPR